MLQSLVWCPSTGCWVEDVGCLFSFWEGCSSKALSHYQWLGSATGTQIFRLLGLFYSAIIYHLPAGLSEPVSVLMMFLQPLLVTASADGLADVLLCFPWQLALVNCFHCYCFADFAGFANCGPQLVIPLRSAPMLPILSLQYSFPVLSSTFCYLSLCFF